jgi:TPR repeat protein
MMATMEKPWYRKLFSRQQKPAQEVTQTNADYEDAEVQFGMGLKYASGKGTAKDYVKAAEWYRKAADQNHSLAQFNLGTMCATGQGMTRDSAESAAWFGKAAQLGDAGAQFNLGKSCHRASLDGIPEEAPESRIEAYKWYRLAAAQGYNGSGTACTTLILNMTREDVADGDQRVAEFAAVKVKLAQD